MSAGTVVGYEALAIGGSAGSLPVVTLLLENVAADSALAIVICVHTESRDVSRLCAMFARHCALPIRQADEREPLVRGQVCVAGGGYHLLVERARHFALCSGERVQFVRPSIDVLFETMAEAYRARLAAILLSGANADGAQGLRRVQQLGGLARVQCPDTAFANDAMPRAALELLCADYCAGFWSDYRQTPAQLGAVVYGLSPATD